MLGDNAAIWSHEFSPSATSRPLQASFRLTDISRRSARRSGGANATFACKLAMVSAERRWGALAAAGSPLARLEAASAASTRPGSHLGCMDWHGLVLDIGAMQWCR